MLPYKYQSKIDFLLKDIPLFIKNIRRFKKELFTFHPYDSSYSLMMLKRSIELNKDFIDIRSLEEGGNRHRELFYMRKAVYLLNSIIEDGITIEHLAEIKLNRKIIKYDLFDKSIPQKVKDDNLEFYQTEYQIRREMIEEVFKILKGDDREGTGIDGWWI